MAATAPPLWTAPSLPRIEAERVLGLQEGVVAHRRDDHPGRDGPERGRGPEEAVADREQAERAGGQARQRDPVEERGQEDQQEARDLADRGDVAELRPPQPQLVLE